MQDLQQSFERLIAQHGPWRMHSIRLSDTLCTMDPSTSGDGWRLRRFLASTDHLRPVAGTVLTVLDLACGEGLYGLEYARRGARVTAIEGRPQNLAKARFAAEVLGLEVDFRLGDVREVSHLDLGTFDVVICSGILYHLDAPDVFRFVESVRGLTAGLALFDTRIASEGSEWREWRGDSYEGASYTEFGPDATAKDRAGAFGSSIGNDQSFWFTTSALTALLKRSGFHRIAQLHEPPHRFPRVDRITLAASPAGVPDPLTAML